MLVQHYRAIGVEKFAVMDNESDDGTFEWCLKQTDLDLFHCAISYETTVKEGWINRIISHYGFNRWYMITDSDELLVYKGMESHPISDLIKYAEEHHLKRIRGLMLDMYPNGPLFEKTEDIRKTYRWFDTDSYKEKDLHVGKIVIKSIIGGPRYRLMGVNVTLSKFPLCFFEPGTVSESAHYQFPRDCVNTSPYHVGILHYKFLDNDRTEYKARMEAQGGFFDKGKQYLKYMEYLKNHEDMSFMYEGSREFTDSSVLDEIGVIDPIEL